MGKPPGVPAAFQCSPGSTWGPSTNTRWWGWSTWDGYCHLGLKRGLWAPG